MSASIVIAPIAGGRLEEWRAFHAELTGRRRPAWAESQRRRGITREVVFLWPGPAGPSAVYLVEGAEAGAAVEDLGASSDAFDVWLRERLAHLHDRLDFPDRLSDTRPAEGARGGWRGLVSLRRRP